MHDDAPPRPPAPAAHNARQAWPCQVGRLTMRRGQTRSQPSECEPSPGRFAVRPGQTPKLAGATSRKTAPGDCRGPSRLHSVSTSNPVPALLPVSPGRILQDASGVRVSGSVCGGLTPVRSPKVFLARDLDPPSKAYPDHVAHVVSLVSETTRCRLIEVQQ